MAIQVIFLLPEMRCWQGISSSIGHGLFTLMPGMTLAEGNLYIN